MHVGAGKIQLATGRTADGQAGEAFALIPGAHQEAFRGGEAIAENQREGILGVDLEGGIDLAQFLGDAADALGNGSALAHAQVHAVDFGPLDDLVGQPEVAAFAVMRFGAAIGRIAAAAQGAG